MQLNPYIFFNGQCEEAFTFYAIVLGGTIEAMTRHEGTPAGEQVPPEWKNKILHARMKVGEHVLMASDAPPGHYRPAGGYSLSINLTDPAEADRVFNALAEKGSVTMPIAKTFWALRFGMLVDRFGIPWMVNCDQPAS